MFFAPDTTDALSTVVSLINSASSSQDELIDDHSLTAFLRREDYYGFRAHDEPELEAVRLLRDRLRTIWQSPVDEAAQLLNDMLAQAQALPQLMRHDGLNWHLHGTSHEAPLEQRMASEAAMALVDVIRTGEWERVLLCSAPDCEKAVLDLSKNRSKRFCSTTCANRTHVAAYRSRQRNDG